MGATVGVVSIGVGAGAGPGAGAGAGADAVVDCATPAAILSLLNMISFFFLGLGGSILYSVDSEELTFVVHLGS